ncbi:hematopoietic lineage cell-specific protein isoform X3 [Electrophorus electricus]|uniref:SH3 domain-containing protein n=1 Tax=Electrophorus electricus TaxID=8005 RepID=A0AAY5EC36_ELEEL|nr:hematopoietic lineage cell-specific protein isoform X3 [Electrophorus electricus]
MWKSVVGHNVNAKAAAESDDWETDPDFENDISEQEQRWGSKTIEGSGRKEHISVADLRQKVSHEHEEVKKKQMEQGPKASYGYGGKYGVEKDRMDKVALGHSYVAEVEQHSSQKDAAKGFGGKYGVQQDRVDKSAMGYEYKGEVEKHTSQKDYATGFGGKYGVQKERVDKAAVGYEYKGETEKHQSQKDYSKGFGGKYGVETEKVDRAALGYDYKGETEKHQSQKDYAKGFGGKYGVAVDRMDKSASSFSEMEAPTSSYKKTQPSEASSAGAGNLKARFENMAKASEEENRRRAEEERARRQAREQREHEEARNRQQLQSSEEAEQRTVPAPAPQPPSQEFRPLPETPKDLPDPVHEVDEQPEYEEPPSLPLRSADLLEEEQPDEDSPPPLPHREADEGEYEEIAKANFTATDNDYEDVGCGLSAVALYDYQGEADDELSFVPEDIIINIEMVDEGWWKGSCHGRSGLFPASFVKLM